jgi:hypothetical protein
MGGEHFDARLESCLFWQTNVELELLPEHMLAHASPQVCLVKLLGRETTASALAWAYTVVCEAAKAGLRFSFLSQPILLIRTFCVCPKTKRWLSPFQRHSTVSLLSGARLAQDGVVSVASGTALDSSFALHKSSLRLVPASNGAGYFKVEFAFDATTPCNITVHVRASVLASQAGDLLYATSGLLFLLVELRSHEGGRHPDWRICFVPQIHAAPQWSGRDAGIAAIPMFTYFECTNHSRVISANRITAEQSSATYAHEPGFDQHFSPSDQAIDLRAGAQTLLGEERFVWLPGSPTWPLIVHMAALDGRQSLTTIATIDGAETDRPRASVLKQWLAVCNVAFQ